ncbi:MAG TPA: hypothetical protein VK886_14445 [Vicinamibacterales bacterium]|nr:hypothetical protein [Vicinamibacterales bacterium]
MCLAAPVATGGGPVTAQNRTILISAVLNGDVTRAALTEFGRYGTIVDVLEPLDAVTIRGRASALAGIRELPFVAAAGEDGGASGSPVDTVTFPDFAAGANTWNLDVVDVTDGVHRAS